MTFTFTETRGRNYRELQWYHAGILIGIGYLLHIVVEGVLVSLGWYYIIKPAYYAVKGFIFTFI